MARKYLYARSGVRWLSYNQKNRDKEKRRTWENREKKEFWKGDVDERGSKWIMEERERPASIIGRLLL